MDDFFNTSIQWLSSNFKNIVYSAIFVFMAYALYSFSSRQITKLRGRGRLDETVSFLLKKILRWGLIFLVVAFTIAQLGIRIDLVAGLAVLASGTVIGFAAMNTLGNAIAGLILMVSRPFKIGDRLSPSTASSWMWCPLISSTRG